MPSLKKILSKFSEAEQLEIESTIATVISLNWRTLDIKKLKGHENIYRVRRGRLRIIFSKEKKGISIFAIERRKEDTYKF